MRYLSGAPLAIKSGVGVSAPMMPSYVRTSLCGIIKTVLCIRTVSMGMGLREGMGRDALENGWDVTGQLT